MCIVQLARNVKNASMTLNVIATALGNQYQRKNKQNVNGTRVLFVLLLCRAKSSELPTYLLVRTFSVPIEIVKVSVSSYQFLYVSVVWPPINLKSSGHARKVTCFWAAWLKAGRPDGVNAFETEDNVFYQWFINQQY